MPTVSELPTYDYAKIRDTYHCATIAYYARVPEQGWHTDGWNGNFGQLFKAELHLFKSDSEDVANYSYVEVK